MLNGYHEKKTKKYMYTKARNLRDLHNQTHACTCVLQECTFIFYIIILSMFQNAFDHAKAKKDGVILPNKGECMS